MKKIIITAAFVLGCLYANAQVGVGTNTPTSTLDVNGSLATKITEVTNPNSYVLDITHQTVVFRGTGGNILLPAASTCIGREYTLVNFASGSVITNTNFDDGIGATNFVPTMTVFRVKSDGTKWIQVDKTGTTSTPDGSETKVNAGTGVSVTGSGTTASPYKVDLYSGIKFIYMPSVSINTSSTGAGRTLDLYNTYKSQFNTPQVASTSAPAAISFFPNATDLYYYVTYYDTNVFNNVSINANGLLTYDVIGTATDCTYMNIVFVVK